MNIACLCAHMFLSDMFLSVSVSVSLFLSLLVVS